MQLWDSKNHSSAGHDADEWYGNKKAFFGYVGTKCVGVLKNEDKEELKVSFFSFLFTVRVCSQVPCSLCLVADPGGMKHYPGYKEID